MSVGVVLSLILLGLVYFAFRFYACYKLNYWKRRGVEQLPNSSIIFGNFKDATLFRRAPGSHLGVLHKSAVNQDASILGFYIFHKPCLLLREPEIIKQIMIRNFEHFSDRHFDGSQQKDSIGMKNLFGLRNPAWKYLRSKITPTLVKGKLRDMLPLIIETGKPMMDYLQFQTIGSVGEKMIDAQELNYKYTTDLIANVALGTPIDSFRNPDQEFTKAVKEFFHGFKRMVALVTVFFMPELVGLIGTGILFNSKFVGKVFWKAMNSREKNNEKRGDYIDSLIQLKNGIQNPNYKFEGENLLYQSGTFFSGFESSSTTAAFTLMELAAHPTIQERARQDIERAIKEKGFTYEAFTDMKYLNQCVAEGIRLHPPVSTIDRYTLQDYQIPGTDITIEKGTPIFISLYGMHQDSRFFESPKVFNPERFANHIKIPNAYIPFGIGPRMCVGMKAGELHAKVVLAMILRDYKVTQPPENQIVLDPRSTFTAAADGINLHFEKIIKQDEV